MRVSLFFKDFSHWSRSSCVGLNVAGYTTAAYLREHGIDARAHAVRHNVDVAQAIERENPNHVIISAPWLSLYDLRSLVTHFWDIKFAVLSHSNVGFLQADPGAIELLRLYAVLADHHRNLRVGGNNSFFVHWFYAAYNEPCVLLPNLYPTRRIQSKVWNGFGPLKIGAFGAIRPEKNFITAAAASIVISKELRVPIELHMSSGGENCQSTTLRAIEEMVEGLDNVKLIRHHWQYWDQFIQLIKRMDLVIQVSYTESFNMVSADAISNGVPVVISPVIRWGPEKWKADPDDVMHVAKVGVHLLLWEQGHRGSDALIEHNKIAFVLWKRYLSTP